MKIKINKLLLSFAFILPMLFRIDFSQEAADSYISLNKNNPVRQSFVSNHNNLYAVSFFINKGDLSISTPMKFTLYEKTLGGTKAAEINFDAKNIGSYYWLKLTFPPIKNSLGKVYVAYIEAPFYDKKGIEVAYGKNIDILNNQSFIGNKKLEGLFTFKTFYKITPKDYVVEVTKDLIKRLSNDKVFLIFYSASLLICGVLFIRYFRKS